MATTLYSWLDPSQRHFRLLRLGPSQGDTIVGTLHVHSLDSHPEFDSLSYAWGPPTIENKAIINGTRINVTSNLYNGLQAIRPQSSSQCIWIDAICINQRDFAERAYQVILMRDIFSQAANVHIWLGSGHESTQRVLYVLGRAGRRLEPSFEDAEKLPEEIASLVTADLEQVFVNTWWDRLWVVQEAALARHPVAHIGPHSIHFSRLLMGILALFNLRGKNGPESTLPWYMMQFALKFSAPITAAASERPHMKLIPDLLAAMRGSKVSVSHDRIYGILGLLPAQLGILPDYGRPLEEVYEEFTLRCIFHERSLDILALGGMHDDTPSGIPTCVPPYETMAPYLFRGTSGFDASKALALTQQKGYPDKVASLSTPRQLTVWMYVVESISFALAVVPEDLDVNLLERSPENKKQNIDDLQKRACECIINLRATRPLSETLRQAITALWSIMLGGEELSKRLSRLGEDFSNWLFLQDDSKYSPAFYPMIRSLLSGAKCNVFTTSARRLAGIVSGRAVAGDLLVILAGASTPVILRRVGTVDEGKFRYVGHSFTMGLLHGEVTSQAAREKNGDKDDVRGVFERVTLV